jgi:DNA-binding response OmpR family regulator
MRGLALTYRDGGGHGNEGPAPGLVRAGDVVLDEVGCTVSIGARRIPVSTAHARLLAYFIRHANTVVTRDELAANLWSGKEIDLRSIDVAIVRLRQALQEPELGRVIRTVHSEGYEFVGVPERIRLRGAQQRGKTGRHEVKE